jgi:hypothetical protein
MAYLPQQVIPQGVPPNGTDQNMVNTAPPPVIIMVPTPAPVKQKIQYEKLFHKNVMLALSSIQLAMAILGIITAVAGLSVPRPEAHFVGAGIWCGLLFGFSGSFGILASLRPSFATIVTFMVFSIIAAAFCLPFLVISSVGTASTYRRRSWGGHGYTLSHAMFAIQIIISLVQAITSIAASAMTCRAICSCCRSNKESGVVYYSNNGASGMVNMPSQQVMSQQLQPGYITIPISQIQAAAAAGATAIAHENALRDNATDEADAPPQKYETVAELDEKNQEGDGSKYQRFQ